MKRLLALLFLCLPVLAVDCPNGAVGNFNFSGGNGAYQVDNRSTACVTWLIAYQADSGLSGYTLAFQSTIGLNAPDTTMWGAYGGTTVAQSTSFGTAALGLATYTNIDTTGSATVNTPWVRVLVTGASGSGNIRGTIYGYQLGATGGTGGGGGGGGGSGCANPCPVEGTAGAGSAPSGPPVQVGGSDGTDMRTIKTDSNGNTQIIGGIAVGSTAPNPVTTGTRDDSGNVAADYRFPDQASVSGSSVSGIKLVAGVAAKLIYVGHVSLSIAAGTTVQFVEGTGTLCATSQTAISGAYQNTVAVALDFTRDDPMKTATTGDDLCVLFGASTTGGGLIKYAQR